MFDQAQLDNQREVIIANPLAAGDSHSINFTDLIDLINIYGSPLYVYERAKLENTIKYITEVFSYQSTQFHFASVTNGNIALLQIFQQAGWGLHANTPGDVYLGLTAGFAPGDIVYTGSNLTKLEMMQMLNDGVATFNLDSIDQIELFCQVYQEFRDREEQQSIKLGLRLNLPELTGDSRIGVHPEEFPRAIALGQQVGLSISGLHFYRGTGTNATDSFTDAIETVMKTAQLLPDWQYLDFGGGFGYPYRSDGLAFDWQIFGESLSEKLTSLNRPIELKIEPGRAAIAGCGKLLTQVVAVKWQGQKQIVGVDTTIGNLAVLAVHGGYRQIVSGKTGVNAQLYETDVCGNTTYSRDYLGKNCLLPRLEQGDILVILDVGAYGFAMSSHFLHRPRPAEILIEGNQHRLIRQREHYNILLHNQIF
jgi:diaminopimelate decarboxylase